MARRALDGALSLGDLWSQHNEHRILVPRLQFIVDYALFDGRLTFLLAMVLISSVLLGGVMTWPIATVWRDRVVTLGFLTFVSATLSPAGIENLSWPFQVGLVQAYLFAVAAIVLSVCWLRVELPNRLDWLALISIVILGAGATYSSANGLLVWPVVWAVMLRRKVGWRSVALVGAAGIVLIGSYLWHYEPVEGHSPYAEAIRHPLGLARYVAVFLGHPAQPLGWVAVQVTGVLGVVLLAVIVYFAIRNRLLPGQRALLFGVATGLFVLEQLS